MNDHDGLTAADWARYGGLFALGTLVLLVIVGPREGGFATLVAAYLLVASVALLVVELRRRRP